MVPLTKFLFVLHFYMQKQVLLREKVLKMSKRHNIFNLQVISDFCFCVTVAVKFSSLYSSFKSVKVMVALKLISNWYAFYVNLVCHSSEKRLTTFNAWSKVFRILRLTL